MIQFPVVWLVSVLSVIAATTLAQNVAVPARARFLLCSFLISLAVLAGLVGARLAVWIDWALALQPVIAVMISPLAYLGFRALTRHGLPSRKSLLLFFCLPILCIQIAFLSPLPMPIDLLILAINGTFLVRMSLLLRLPSDDFPHTPPHALNVVKGAILGVCILLVLMISADLLIVFATMTGGNGAAISFVDGAAGFLTFLTILATLVGASILVRKPDAQRPTVEQKPVATDMDKELLRSINKIVVEHQLFRDSNLTLARLARRAGVPSRDISSAINRATGENFSRYINQLRVDLAQSLLKTTDLPITEIQLQYRVSADCW